jgi:hypothetical protein
MAKGPMAAPLAQEDDAHGEIQDDVEAGSGGPEGQEGADEAEDASLDIGEEQAAGSREDVDAEPPSRGETRFQRLANENQELKRRLTDLERRPAPTVQPQAQQEETEEQFQARTAHLMPDERMEQRQLRSERRFARQLAFTEFRSQDMADKASFDAKATIDTRYQRYAAEVETKRNELLAQGMVTPREAILKFLIGEKVLTAQKNEGQRNQAARNVRRQQAKPTGGRSDVQPTRGRVSEAEARRRRLEDAEL